MERSLSPRLKWTALTVLALCPVAGQAGTVAADTARILDEVVVIDRTAKAPVALLPLDVKIVGSDILDSSAQTNVLPVLQNRVPGMFVTERGLAGYGVSGDAAGAVSIRGVGGGNKVLFMIDGQPQWAGIFGHSLPDTYVINDIERVEVVSGPSSLLYGSGAMGGSVNLITRKASRRGFSANATLIGGSYGTQKYNARAGYRHKNMQVLAGASYESTDGSRRGMDYWLANQFATVSFDFSPHWSAGVNGMLTETRADNPGSVYRTKPLDMWARQFRTTASVFVKNDYGRTSGGIQAYYNMGKHKIDDGLDSNDRPRTYYFRSHDYNMGVTAYQTVKPWDGNNLSLGVDFKHWGGRAYNTDKKTGSETPITDKHVNEIAGYAMMQQALWQDRISLNAGARIEHSSQFGNQWIPQAGFIVRPHHASTVKFNYAKGFRSPNIRELYMYPPHNPDLRPELMDNYEVEYRTRLLGGHLDLGAALYYINGKNMIQTVRIDGRPRNINTGKFINKGVEVDATYTITPKWSVTANYAYLHTSRRIVGAPRNKFFVECAFTPARWHFSLDMQAITSLPTTELSATITKDTPHATEDYVLVNARVAYTVPIKLGLTVFLKGENLTATSYHVAYGFPMPRATVYGGLTFTY